MDNYKTDVLFLIEKPEGDLPCDVFAYFPNEKYYGDGETLAHEYSFDLRMRTCYAHIGQHSACHPNYASECKEASPDEFKPLMEELESIGYDLNILNK
jgi:hypothetical protein